MAMIGNFGMVQTAHGQWLVYDTSTSEVHDNAEDAADALALRSGDELLATNDDLDQPPGRE